MLAAPGRHQAGAAGDLAQVLRQLPLDAVSALLEDLGSDSRRSLKLACKDLLSLVRACSPTIHFTGLEAEQRSSAVLKQQVQALEAYTSARRLEIRIHDGLDLASTLVGCCQASWSPAKACRAEWVPRFNVCLKHLSRWD
jgi:hypothetical protein